MYRTSLAKTTATEDGDLPFSVLLRLLELPDLLQEEVLKRLGPADLASLAGAGRACAAAVAATTLMKWAKAEKTVPSRSNTLLYPV